MSRKSFLIIFLVALALSIVGAKAGTAPTISTTTGVLDLEPQGTTPHTTSFTIVMTGSPTPTVSVTSISINHNSTISNPGSLPSWLTVSSAGLVTGTPPTDGSVSTNDTITLGLDATNGTAPDATQSLVITLGTVINTTSEGAVTYTLSANGGVYYFSAPLETDAVYTGAITTPLASNALTVAGTPWTASQYVSAATPYFVKMLSGLQAGRAMLITANSTNSLMVDINDHNTQQVPLTTSNFSVAAGDAFEIFPGDTLESMFVSNGTPILTGATSPVQADLVSLFSPSLGRYVSYYYDTGSNFWKQSGLSTNANNTIIYPNATFEITRRPQAALTFTLMGRVPAVSHLVKAMSNVNYNSTGYPVDMKLSGLNLGAIGAPWVEGTSSVSADTLGIWNSSFSRFDTYFQFTDGTWRKDGAGSVDQSNFVISAGTTVVFVKRTPASTAGPNSFLVPAIPYTSN